MKKPKVKLLTVKIPNVSPLENRSILLGFQIHIAFIYISKYQIDKNLF